MSEGVTLSHHRAQRISLFGFLLQLVFCGGLFVLSALFESDVIQVLARFMIIGIPIWFTLYLVFTQMRRVSAEALETEELKRAHAAGDGDALFDLDDDALLLEQNRLRWMIRWILPSTTILIALILLAGQFIGWGWSFDDAFAGATLQRTENPTMVMWFVVGIGVLCFLYARYSIALARIPQWRVIRGGATIMHGNALACLIVAISMMASGSIEWAEPVIAYALRVCLIVVGIEMAMNFVLDFYRPRSPNEIPRPAFDSRLLGLISEPGGFTKSLADAVNYQFGFEVSSTWFYQLLQRWMLPIMVLTAVAILLLTSVVIVAPSERVVIERFGRAVGGESAALSPGIYLKWPYPVDVVYRAPVARVQEIVIGEATAELEDTHAGHDLANLWDKEHEYVPELMLLVASEKDKRATDSVKASETDDAVSQSSPMSLLMVSVPIQYRIKDIHRYLYKYDDPKKLLEAEAYRILSDYASGVDIAELMGPGREDFNRDFRRMLQQRIDELDVGFEIVFAGVADAHPPAKAQVAQTFQSVIQAQIQQAADVQRAEGEARRILVQSAGTVTRARELDEAINTRNESKESAGSDAEVVAAADQRVQDLLFGNVARGISPPGGAVAQQLANARAKASREISQAAAKVRKFSTEVAAYEAAPKLYLHRKNLAVYENLGFIRRYLIAGNPENVIINYTTQKEAALDQVLAEEDSGG